MSKALMLTIVIATAGFLAMPGCAHHWGHGHWGGEGLSQEKADRMVGKLSKKLDLGPNQVADLEKMKDEILAKADELGLRGGMGDIMKEMSAQASKETFDVEKLDGMMDDKEARMKEMRKFVLEKFAVFHAKLNGEQRQKLSDMIDKRCRRWN